MDSSFKGRVAVVTGAAHGIGRALAERCAAEGMRCVLGDIDVDALQALATELGPEAEVETVPVDVTRNDQVAALARRTKEQFGAADLLFLNAGVANVGKTWEFSDEDWDHVLSVNLLGVARGIRAFVPGMIGRQEESRVVITASAAGLVSGPGLAPYRTSKHAVVALAETLEHDLRSVEAPVRVSVLCPDFVRTGIARRAVSCGQEGDAAKAGIVAAVDEGLAPERVADATFEAIRAGRFYILTHPESVDLIETRVRKILDP